MPTTIRDRFSGVEETSRIRILLEGPVCRAWYLGERFLCQTLGLPEQIVPVHPPEDMRETERLTTEQMADYTIGWEVTRFRGVGDYREYVQTYIIRSLSGGRRVEGARPVAPAARAGAELGGYWGLVGPPCPLYCHIEGRMGRPTRSPLLLPRLVMS